jgi:hypothetical protein
MIGPVIRFCGRLVTSQRKTLVLSLRWASRTERSNSTRLPLIWKNMRLSCSCTAARSSSSSVAICSSIRLIFSFMVCLW